jgi:hypothetical protein
LAIASTFDSAVPVSGVSSLRCLPHGAWPFGAAAAANAGAAVLELDELEPEPVAALAAP